MAVPEDYRRQSRRRWSATARGWGERADALRRATMPVSAWMIDAIEPQPGHQLLELAAGPGDTGFLAAELVEPGGTLICSDFVPEMLTVAQERAERLGLRNVRFRQIDAEVIDQPAATLDGVLCRWGYMLMPDPEAALRETRRVLRTGGRLALAAWTGPEENPWSAEPIGELARRGIVEDEAPGGPGQYGWAAPGAVAERLEAAGFVEPRVERLAFTMPYADVREWWTAQRALSMRFADADAALDAGTRAEVQAALARHAEPDGSLALPAATWVAAAAV